MLTIYNQLPELLAFVESVELNSFSAAARMLGTTPSAISKRVAKLEERLGIRLLQRTTRSLNLTTEGATYYEQVARLLRELEAADQSISAGGKPKGKLTISASLDFGQWLLVQSIPQFMTLYPEIEVDLRLSDHLVDLVLEGIDVAIRLGDLEDSSLIRTHLGQASFALCASPRYLNEHGRPHSPHELLQYNCLCYVFNGRPVCWDFFIDQRWETVAVSGTFNADNGGALLNAAVAGLGITRLCLFQIQKEIEEQQLEVLLSDYLQPGFTVHALVTHQRHLSPRVRAFLDFLKMHCKSALF
ncbi:MAG: LysR substrate-binding domain-containing protein [Phormidesmis sp.]|mgnify:CR=1 FL=1